MKMKMKMKMKGGLKTTGYRLQGVRQDVL